MFVKQVCVRKKKKERGPVEKCHKPRDTRVRSQKDSQKGKKGKQKTPQITKLLFSKKHKNELMASRLFQHTHTRSSSISFFYKRSTTIHHQKRKKVTLTASLPHSPVLGAARSHFAVCVLLFSLSISHRNIAQQTVKLMKRVWAS